MITLHTEFMTLSICDCRCCTAVKNGSCCGHFTSGLILDRRQSPVTPRVSPALLGMCHIRCEAQQEEIFGLPCNPTTRFGHLASRVGNLSAAREATMWEAASLTQQEGLGN